jgi:hypothetical protein
MECRLEVFGIDFDRASPRRTRSGSQFGRSPRQGCFVPRAVNEAQARLSPNDMEVERILESRESVKVYKDPIS